MYSNQTFVPGVEPGAISHLAALALLGTIFLCGATLFAAVVLWLAGRPHGAARTALVAPGVLTLYIATLTAVALVSRDRSIGRGEEKYFCELDCHLAYTVLDVRPAGAEAASLPAPARGRYWVVTVRTRFDSTTIAPWRPRDVPVFPDLRELVIVDRSGARFAPAAPAQAALTRSGAALSTLSRPLIPGESALSRVIFDLPRDVAPERVLLYDTDMIHRVLIADEGSMLHGLTFWRI